MDINQIKRVAGSFRAALFKNSNSFSIGMLKSHFKGTGLQFKEHQIYSHGDDVRFIDWKMMAKTSRPYIKTFEEERNVEITVVIDAGATMYAGHQGVSKLQAAVEICCLLYLLARETGDYVHAIILGDRSVIVPKKSGEDGIVHLIAALSRAGVVDEKGNFRLQARPEQAMTPEERIAKVMPHLIKKRQLVLLSDFDDFLQKETLKKLLYRSHVHCFQILSPLDEAKAIPYALHLIDQQKSSMQKVAMDGEKKFVNPLGKRFKQLRVHDRYLENFIKEML